MSGRRIYRAIRLYGPNTSSYALEGFMWNRIPTIFFFSAALTACDTADTEIESQTIQVKSGCYSSSYAAAGADQIGCGLLQSTGNATVDRQTNEEYAILAQFYRLPQQPSMYLFDECPEQMNALSFPQGFILMGFRLMQETAIRYNSLLPYAGVMAHEWGHQIQFQRNYIDRSSPTARDTELAADAWAGYYLYMVKNWSGADLESFLRQLFDIGDFEYNSPSHHGTPNERRYMGAYGMDVARFVLENDLNPSYDELHQTWLNALAQMGSIKSEQHRQSIQTASLRPRNDLLNGILDGTRPLSEIVAGTHDPLFAPTPK